MKDKSSRQSALDRPILELRKLSIQERTKRNDRRLFSHMIDLLNAYEKEEKELLIEEETGGNINAD